MKCSIKILLTLLIIPVLILPSYATTFDQSAQILNPKEVDIFSSLGLTKGPFIDNNNIILAKDGSIYVLDLNGKTTLSFPTGGTINGIPKTGTLNGQPIFFVTSNNLIYIFTNKKIIKEIPLNGSTIYDSDLIDSEGSKIVATFNYPSLSELNGSTIWERPNIEARGIIVTDLDTNEKIDFIFYASQINVLDLSGNIKWSKDIFCIQPPQIFQLKLDQSKEILCPTKNELIALDYSGNILWKVQQVHQYSDQPLVQVYGNKIIEAVSNKLIFRDLNGQKLSEIQTEVVPKSLDLVDINNDNIKDYLISDDISLHAFSDDSKLWSLNIKEGVVGLTLADVDQDNLLEILVGTTEGIVIVDHKDEPLIAQFTLSKTTALVAETILLDASGSRPKNIKYRWDFKSDSIFDTQYLEVPSINHSYNSEGIYLITLEITNDNQTKSAKKKIEIFKNNEPPTAKLTAPKSIVKVGSEIILIVVATDREEDNLLYRFDVDGDGFFETSWQKSGSFQTKTTSKGTYSAVVEVKDQTNPPITAITNYKVVEPQKIVEEETNPLIFPIIAISVTVSLLVLIIIVFIYSKKHSFERL